MSKLQEKTSDLKREHPALQKIKFINFLLVIFVHLDPDPEAPLNPDSQHRLQLWDIMTKSVVNF